MTVSEVITLGLSRAGIQATTSTARARALLYLNETLSDLSSRPAQGWWWLVKSSSFTTVDGTRTYTLATDLLVIRQLRDSTNGRMLTPVGLDFVLEADPDLDEEGDARCWYPTGVSSANGRTMVGLYPIPGTTGDTIAYEYYAFIDSLTNADDATSDMHTTYGLPRILEMALSLGIAKRYQQQEGDLESSVAYHAEYETIIKRAMRLNGQQQITKELRLQRPHGGRGLIPVYQPEEGSLS